MKKKLLCLALAALLCLPAAAFAACGEETVPPPGPSGHATIVSFGEFLSLPKTSYLPAEVFNISGLAVSVNLSDGTTKKFFDADFTEWTHQGEELTEDVDVITVTIPGTDITFDVAITVSLPEGAGIELELGALYSANGKSNEWFLTTDVIDFTVITVNYIVGATFTKLTAADWSLYEGEEKIADPAACTLGEGEHTLTVKYLTMSEDFTVLVKDADAVITPELIEAEDCTYSVTSNALYVNRTQKTTPVETFLADGSSTTTSVNMGASGTCVNALASFQNGPNVYFQFDVKVPEDGEYKILVKGQSSSLGGISISSAFTVNLNNEKDAGGELVYRQSVSSEKVLSGNRTAEFFDADHSYTSWNNQLFWSEASIGTYYMEAGVNTVRMKLVESYGFNGNIDLFRVVKADEDSDIAPKLFSIREGAQASLEGNKVYLTKGTRLSDFARLPEEHPVRYTGLYFRPVVPGRQMIPVTEAMLSAIDYDRLGDQTVTVHVVALDGTDYGTATFTLCIIEQSDG